MNVVASRRPRAAAAVVGLLMIAAALLSGPLGLDQSGGFGRSEATLAVLGGALALFAALGRWAGRALVFSSLCLVGSAALLFVVEMILTGLHLPSDPELDWARRLKEYSQKTAYYSSRDWGVQHWEEMMASLSQRYSPYSVWRRRPFAGQTITVNQDGRRSTPGSVCGKDNPEVWVFGGSAVWGWGSPDWGTIPAYLATELAQRLGTEICVVNQGENAYVATQELVLLVQELAGRARPDFVVYYDGINDVTSAYQSGRPGLHHNLEQIARRFESGGVRIADWFGSLRVSRLIARNDHEKRDTGRVLDAGLALAICESYLGVVDAVRALAGDYGFDYAFFWQPHPATSDKPLTGDEALIMREMDFAWPTDEAALKLQRHVTRLVQEAASTRADLVDLTRVFDTSVEQVWADSGGHLVPEGNQIIARQMTRHIAMSPRLADAARR